MNALDENNGISLVEMVTVVALISLFSAFALPTFFSERQYQEVADAVRKAQQIATSIDYGRAMGVVEPFEGSLAAFIADADNQVEDYMVVITDPFEFQGYTAQELFFVTVNSYSTQLSFGLSGDEFQDFNFPSSVRSVEVDEDTGISTVTWTVGPSVGSALNIAYGVNHYINAD
ncbi:MAG TPA: hypothetical protein DCS92_07855 [Gammaproteobacteria bacterium]|nr:hypothetical protein [Gammaproteobacteria bacterium]